MIFINYRNKNMNTMENVLQTITDIKNVSDLTSRIFITINNIKNKTEQN